IRTPALQRTSKQSSTAPAEHRSSRHAQHADPTCALRIAPFPSMQRPPPLQRRPSRIPTKLRSSLGDLRAQSTLSVEFAASQHDSGISRSVSLASLASSVPNSSTIMRHQKVAPRYGLFDCCKDGLIELDEDPHVECKIVIDLLKEQNELLKRELMKKQLMMDNVRIEHAAYDRRVVLPPYHPDLESIAHHNFKRSQSCDASLEREVTADDEDDCDQSLIEFWVGNQDVQVSKRNSERSISLTIPDTKTEVKVYRNTPSPTEEHTLEKSQSLESVSLPSKTSTPIVVSSVSRKSCDQSSCGKDLSLQSLPKDDSRSRVERWTAQTPENPTMGPPSVQWRPCRKSRPTQLNISSVPARDGEMVKRLKSPAAFSLLCPRPYSKLPTAFVPPLDLSKLRSSSESETSDHKQKHCKNMTAAASHKILANAQYNAAQSRLVLQNLQKISELKRK
ncbi:Hypothetical predicted protein, partial [Cloeon dipterum]